MKEPEPTTKTRGVLTATCIVPLIIFIMAIMGLEYIMNGTLWTLGIALFLPVIDLLIGIWRSYHLASAEIAWRKEWNEHPPAKSHILTQQADWSIEAYEIPHKKLTIESHGTYWWYYFRLLSIFWNMDNKQLKD